MKTTTTPKKEQIKFTRINNDINGNPRYVCHFMAFINDADRTAADANKSDIFGVNTLYNIALTKARKLGGRKFHNKQYGGGIVFQSYNTAELAISIHEAAKMPKMLTEWTGKEFDGIKKAILRHFKYATISTHEDSITFFNPLWDDINTTFGLAFTSGSSMAGYWVCNIEAESPIKGFKYIGFAADGLGGYYAILWDDNENERILPI